ncbi:hypothetical protein [Streptomyces sp. TS71-3]|uniref:hypothetical protein n=1 Tax=Streptomyces sp. TS71-3 TaxID=2733862 RepID=UPI001B0859F9|nr:hypothetical protein [Streptomyces sp. TS71-3]GHJ40110.1 hypothetical protein Sm713_57190 [Streptomyces sp. TS71-3]
MRPREFWDRNTILAEAFCASDERVRQAQSLLNDAQAERARMLAAFAVTVGSDRTIAALMGLNEREVRTARRAVGRGDARTVAQTLLTPVQQPPQPPRPQQQAQQREPGPPEHAPATPADVHVPHPREEQVPAPPPYDPYTVPHDPTTSTTGQAAPEPEIPVAWSSSMDSVLLWSWKSGLDLQTVAKELGLDVRTLLLRVQVLADDGLLSPGASSASAGTPSDYTRGEYTRGEYARSDYPRGDYTRGDYTRGDYARTEYQSPPPADHRRRSGRHRRHHSEAYTAFFSPTTTFPSYSQH